MTNSSNRLKDLQEKLKASASHRSPGTPFVYEEENTLSLYFHLSSVQSAMLKNDPDYLALGYTRTMMGFLFFQPEPAHIAMIGLGGGSLAKYCLKHITGAHFTAVEVNPEVIALREKFCIPADSEKFTVLHANGADYVANKSDKADVLLVDGFDETGHPAKLCSAGFYDNCYDKLHDGGVMVANFQTNDSKFGTYTARMRDSFEDNVVVVDAEDDGNKIAFACKGKEFPLAKEVLLERVNMLRPKHPIALHNTAQKIIQRLAKHTSHSEWEPLSGARF